MYKKNLTDQVKKFHQNGATWIHVIDLDGALYGENKNEDSIKKVLENADCKVQLGGGIRTIKDIEKWIRLGVSRVIIGTSAIINDGLVKEAVKAFPGRIAVGLDLFENLVAIKGWTEVFKEREAVYFFEKFSDLGVEGIIYTDINKDGVLKGPNFDNILKYKKIVQVPLIASGGVSSFQDIKKLYSFNVDGVIVGKAIYDNKVNLNEIFSLKKDVKN